MGYRRWFGLLAVVVLTLFLVLSLVDRSLAAAPDSAGPGAAWSVSTRVAVAAQEATALGASRARALRVDPVVARMGAAGLTVTVRELAAAGEGIVFQVQGAASGTLDQFRRLIYVDLMPEVNLLGAVTELHIVSGSEQSLTSDVIIAAKPSTGYLWTVAQESGFTESARTDFVMHSRGIGVSQHQILHLRNSMNVAPIKLVYRRPWLSDPATLQIKLELENLPARLDLSDPKAPAGPAGPPGAQSSGGAFPSIETAALPSSFDWRSAGIVTPVRDQSSCGSCWAFGTVGIMESALWKSGSANVDLSEQFLVSCNTSGWNCDGGLTAHMFHFDKIGKSQTAFGAVLEADKPYTSSNDSCTSAYNHPYQLSDWHFIVPYEDQMPTVDQIKSAIYTYGPVTARICAGSGFGSYTGGIFSSDETASCYGGINHQIILVGWNDNGGAGYWILRNSWGAAWGNDGYMDIAYNTSRVGEGTSWVTTAASVPSFYLTAAQGTVTVFQGETGSTTLTSSVAGGFAGAVALGVSGAPPGVSASLAPASFSAPGSGSSTLTFSVAATVATGSYPVKVTGTGAGVTKEVIVTLKVRSTSEPLLFSDGFEAGAGWNYLQMTGTTASWSITDYGKNPSIPPHDGSAMAEFNSFRASSGDSALYYLASSFTIPSTVTTAILKFWMYHDTGYPESTSEQLRPYISTDGTNFNPVGPAVARYDGTNRWEEVSADLTAYRGEGTVQIGFLGTSAFGNNIYLDDVSVEAQTAAADFTLAAAPTTVSVPQGGSGTTTLTTTLSGGFDSPVALSASDLPSGVSTAFSPAAIAAPGEGSSVLSFTVAGNAAAGSYPITVTGTGGGQTHQVTVTLTVTVPPSFSLSAQPTTLTVARGGSGATTLTSTVSGGFDSALTLTAAGLPQGVTATFTPSGIAAPGSGSSTLSFMVATSAAAGSYPVTVSGNGGGVSKTITMTLAVSASLAPLFSIPGAGDYFSFSEMYASLASGSSVVARAANAVIEGGMALDRNVTLALRGGYDSTFTGVTGRSIVHGALIVRRGKLALDKFAIR